MSRPDPPKKLAEVKTGRRKHAGKIGLELLDVGSLSEQLKITEDETRARVSRGLLPYRKWGGRIVFLGGEIEAYFTALPGVTLEQALANTVERSEGAA